MLRASNPFQSARERAVEWLASPPHLSRFQHLDLFSTRFDAQTMHLLNGLDALPWPTCTAQDFVANRVELVFERVRCTQEELVLFEQRLHIFGLCNHSVLSDFVDR